MRLRLVSNCPRWGGRGGGRRRKLVYNFRLQGNIIGKFIEGEDHIISHVSSRWEWELPKKKRRGKNPRLRGMDGEGKWYERTERMECNIKRVVGALITRCFSISHFGNGGSSSSVCVCDGTFKKRRRIPQLTNNSNESREGGREEERSRERVDQAWYETPILTLLLDGVTVVMVGILILARLGG